MNDLIKKEKKDDRLLQHIHQCKRWATQRIRVKSDLWSRSNNNGGVNHTGHLTYPT